METVLRVAFVYILVWACFRVLGKRELTQMSPFELVLLLFIPQLFSRALTRQDYSLTNGIIGFCTLLVLLSLSLGFLNLLPIPILDGGVMLLLLIEFVMGRDLSLRIKERIVQVSMVFLLLMMVVVLYNDVLKLLPTPSVGP